MGVQFLSSEWTEAVTRALNSHEGFTSAAAGVELTIQFVVTDAPEGDVEYHLAVDDGGAGVELGELEDADIIVTTSFETATSIARGDLNVQAAFMTGQLKAGGDLAKLLTNQNLINQWLAASGTVDVEY